MQINEHRRELARDHSEALDVFRRERAFRIRAYAQVRALAAGERGHAPGLKKQRGEESMPFKNRVDAGRKLARALAKYRREQPVILALPRGGVPVAAEVATALHAPLDLILVRKIGVPFQPELAMGAVVDSGAPLIVRNEDVIRLAGIDEAQFKAVCDAELAEIERRRQRYLGGRPRLAVAGRIAIVIDDGVATGATTRAALRATRLGNPKKLVLAVPVAPTDTLASLRADADEVICLEDYEFFGAIGAYYADFSQVADEEVIALLARFATEEAAATSQASHATIRNPADARRS